MSERLYYSSIDTTFGEVTVLWKEVHSLKIQQVILPQLKSNIEEKISGVTISTNPIISNLLHSFVDLLKGVEVSFDLGLLDFSLCTEFQKKVLCAEYGIPRGAVSTYSRIARYIGSPNAARAVGNALASNPFPLIIPCHRAVRSDGSLGGYQGGVEMKKKLLEMEGVQFLNSKVDFEKLFY